MNIFKKLFSGQKTPEEVKQEKEKILRHDEI